ncbi:helix-turn-helix transcriptional regulator [Rhizobium sp. R693]|uniref:helix-turn-helix domain-containing protein n=1 Tax=Rhizobium sp. R693 TaxID=1764276 RepID=UPI000B649172|nr:helix-turn-helix transcriptional regulator [Rhizobium sp. R693]OWV86880.1 hypothetical protein ATY79_08700 [Rhizobium sp. R693]
MLIAARNLLGLSQTEVSTDSGVSRKTIQMAEAGTAGIVSVEKLMRHYQRRGITFVHRDDAEGWGIRTTFLNYDYGEEPPVAKP